MRNELIMHHLGLQSMFTRFGSSAGAQTAALHIQSVAYSLASTKGRTSMIYSATLPRAWRLLADLGARLEAHPYCASAGAAARLRPARSSQRDVNTAVRSGEHTCGLSTVRPLRQPGNKRRQPLSGPALAPLTMHQSLLSALLQAAVQGRQAQAAGQTYPSNSSTSAITLEELLWPLVPKLTHAELEETLQALTTITALEAKQREPAPGGATQHSILLSAIQMRLSQLQPLPIASDGIATSDSGTALDSVTTMDSVTASNSLTVPNLASQAYVKPGPEPAAGMSPAVQAVSAALYQATALGRFKGLMPAVSKAAEEVERKKSFEEALGVLRMLQSRLSISRGLQVQALAALQKHIDPLLRACKHSMHHNISSRNALQRRDANHGSLPTPDQLLAGPPVALHALVLLDSVGELLGLSNALLHMQMRSSLAEVIAEHLQLAVMRVPEPASLPPLLRVPWATQALLLLGKGNEAPLANMHRALAFQPALTQPGSRNDNARLAAAGATAVRNLDAVVQASNAPDEAGLQHAAPSESSSATRGTEQGVRDGVSVWSSSGRSAALPALHPSYVTEALTALALLRYDAPDAIRSGIDYIYACLQKRNKNLPLKTASDLLWVLAALGDKGPALPLMLHMVEKSLAKLLQFWRLSPAHHAINGHAAAANAACHVLWAIAVLDAPFPSPRLARQLQTILGKVDATSNGSIKGRFAHFSEDSHAMLGQGLKELHASGNLHPRLYEATANSVGLQPPSSLAPAMSAKQASQQLPQSVHAGSGAQGQATGQACAASRDVQGPVTFSIQPFVFAAAWKHCLRLPEAFCAARSAAELASSRLVLDSARDGGDCQLSAPFTSVEKAAYRSLLLAARGLPDLASCTEVAEPSPWSLAGLLKERRLESFEDAVVLSSMAQEPCTATKETTPETTADLGAASAPAGSQELAVGPEGGEAVPADIAQCMQGTASNDFGGKAGSGNSGGSTQSCLVGRFIRATHTEQEQLSSAGWNVSGERRALLLQYKNGRQQVLHLLGPEQCTSSQPVHALGPHQLHARRVTRAFAPGAETLCLPLTRCLKPWPKRTEMLPAAELLKLLASLHE